MLRKGEGLAVELVSRSAFEYTAERRARWLAFAEDRFGPGVMPGERLDALLRGRVITHVWLVREGDALGREVGAVLMYLEPPRLAHYYYAFYDRGHANRNLGLGLMTTAITWFRDAGFGHLYLGTCYSERALYKAQFAGLEFFDGVGWSTDVAQLKFLVRRDAQARHLLEDPEFLAANGGPGSAGGTCWFRDRPRWLWEPGSGRATPQSARWFCVGLRRQPRPTRRGLASQPLAESGIRPRLWHRMSVSAPDLLTSLLRDVSRSFYLTLRLLPEPVQSESVWLICWRGRPTRLPIRPCCR